MKKLWWISLLVVVLGGAFLRLYKIDSNPPALNWDEVSHGYNAFSILRTGADEWGQTFPVTNFRAYGDYPLPLNLYITIPFISLFGLNEIGIRIPHALLGVGTIIATYFLTLGLTKRKGMSTVAAFLVAIHPWYLFTSRFVLQSNVSIFFLVTAMALFINRARSKWFVPASLFCLGLTLFSYHTTRIFSPLLLVVLVMLYWKEFRRKLNIFIIVIFFVPLPFILLNPDARARSQEVFIVNPGVVSEIEELRNQSTLPPLASKLLYNRPVYVLKKASLHYIDYMSPHYLFLNGGTQYQFSVPNQGLLYVISLPFLYLGLYIVGKRALISRDKAYQLIFAWFLLAPIPAAITTERFAVLRSTSLLPLPEILVALGLFSFFTYIRANLRVQQFMVLVFIVINIFLLGQYLNQYFGQYREDYSWTWQYGYKEIVQYAEENKGMYDRIIVTKKYGEPHEFVLFYSGLDPRSYQSDSNLMRYTQSNWWWVDTFGQYVFVNDWEIPKEGHVFITESEKQVDCGPLRCLLITSPGNAPRDWQKVKTVQFLDSSPAFELYEHK